MFETLYRYSRVLVRHLDGPAAEERDRFLTHVAATGSAHESLLHLGSELLPVAQRLDVSGTRTITPEMIAWAADRWVRHQRRLGHISTARYSRQRFVQVATDWLRFLGRFEAAPVRRGAGADVVDEFGTYHDPCLSCRHYASAITTGAARAVEPSGWRRRLAPGGPVHRAGLGSVAVRRARWNRGCRLPDRLMKNSPYLVAMYLAIILAGLLFALPNVLPASVLERWPSVLPDKPVALGLDLRGGSHLVLEVDGTDLRRERLRSLGDDARRMLREADIPWRSIEAGERGLSISLRTAEQQDRAVDVLAALPNPVGAARKALDVTRRGSDGVELTLTAEGLYQSISRAVEQSLEIIRQRVDQVGVSEPTIQRVGADRILVQLPGLQDPAQLRSLLGSTAKMGFHRLGDASSADCIRTLQESLGNPYQVRNSVALSGDRLTDASAGFDPQTREPVVNFRFDLTGAREFPAITEANVGRPFAIVLDGNVRSVPVIREPITGGSGQISGSFTVQEAGTLSALLRAGALPAKLTVIDERSVGADLGSDVIQKGVHAGLPIIIFTQCCGVPF